MNQARDAIAGLIFMHLFPAGLPGSVAYWPATVLPDKPGRVT